MASSPDCKIIIFVIELLVAMLHLIRMKEGLAELRNNMRCLFVNFRYEDIELRGLTIGAALSLRTVNTHEHPLAFVTTPRSIFFLSDNNDENSIAQYESWFTLKSLRTLPFPRQSAVRGFGETGRESGPLASET